MFHVWDLSRNSLNALHLVSSFIVILLEAASFEEESRSTDSLLRCYYQPDSWGPIQQFLIEGRADEKEYIYNFLI